ncbi:hypothetical protein [Oceanisphaera sp. W20_SRM_FM3]
MKKSGRSHDKWPTEVALLAANVSVFELMMLLAQLSVQMMVSDKLA